MKLSRIRLVADMLMGAARVVMAAIFDRIAMAS